jgi:hypothetical protein
MILVVIQMISSRIPQNCWLVSRCFIWAPGASPLHLPPSTAKPIKQKITLYFHLPLHLLQTLIRNIIKHKPNQFPLIVSASLSCQLGLPTFEIRNKGHFKGLAPWPQVPLRPPLHQSYRFFYNQ